MDSGLGDEAEYSCQEIKHSLHWAKSEFYWPSPWRLTLPDSYNSFPWTFGLAKKANSLNTCGTAKHLNLPFKGIKCMHCLLILSRCVGFWRSLHLEKMKRERKKTRACENKYGFTLHKLWTNCVFGLTLSQSWRVFSVELGVQKRETVWHWLLCWLVEFESPTWMNWVSALFLIYTARSYRSN